MKGIILAGGSGTRLYPITTAVSKQLLPIYDKPMIYYPLSILMLADIKDILIITTPQDQPLFKSLLNDGSHFGVNLQYAVQEEPKGIAQAFIIGKEFIGDDNVCLILGDNIFYGSGITGMLRSVRYYMEKVHGAHIFGYAVKDPERYGVAEIDNNQNVISLEEKPTKPKSNLAVVGLYMYDNEVISIAEGLKPSNRGELEITDINKEYMRRGNLYMKTFPRGFAWLDTGTVKSMNEASEFIGAIQERQGMQVACLEEIALNNFWIKKEDIEKHISRYSSKNDYVQYVRSLISK